MSEQERLDQVRNLRHRPMVMGTRVAIASGHYLATTAGYRVALQGGNAVDVAAAAGFCLGVVEQQENSPGGEVPILVYSARERKVFAISGVGWSPREFTIDWCRTHNIDLIPGDGYLPACVPAVVGTWAEAVARFGTMSLSQVLQPAIDLAENGYAVYPAQREAINNVRARLLERYPSTCKVYMPEGRVPEVGERIRNPGLAAMFRTLCQAEAQAAGKGRIAGIEAARDAFYKGPIAERIVDFIRSNPVLDDSGSSHAGLLDHADLAEWRATVEAPVSLNYRGLDVHKCSSWTQGPVFLQQLAILDGLDLKAMGHNSADYVHARVEAAKLAFADREAYYGDTAVDAVPFDVLLSKKYNVVRRSLIGPAASLELRPGNVGGGIPDYDLADVLADNRRALGLGQGGHGAATSPVGDTTHLDVVDGEGNMVAATPSGGWFTASPIIEGLGFPLGTRGQMFYLNPKRPNALAGRKRPRATLTPSLVTKAGRPYMAFGVPGGDMQDQTTLQFFISHADFGMDLPQALDEPNFWTDHFPSSFYPRKADPGKVQMEYTFDPAVVEALRARGHNVAVNQGMAPRTTAVAIDEKNGIVKAAVRSTAAHFHALAW